MPTFSTSDAGDDWAAEKRSEALPVFHRRRWIAGLTLCSVGTIGLGALAYHCVSKPLAGSLEWTAVEALSGLILMVAGFACMVAGTNGPAESAITTDSADSAS